MKLKCIALVGKRSDQLLYIRDFPSSQSNVDALSEDYREILGLDTATKSTSWDHCSLQHQFLLSEAAERLEDMIRSPQQTWMNPATTVSANDVMWMGLVYVADNHRVYGYVTSTRIKILAAVEDTLIDNKQALKAKEAILKALLSNIHISFVDQLMNPFSKKNDKIVSVRFNRTIQKYVEAYNTASMSVM